MSYTGTFRGGPYDGEVATYDHSIVMREDPLTEEDEAQMFKAPEPTASYEFLPDRVRAYEFVKDDDGRCWWEPISFPARLKVSAAMPDWTKINEVSDPVGDLRELGWRMIVGRPLEPFERVLIRAGINPLDYETLSEHD